MLCETMRHGNDDDGTEEELAVNWRWPKNGKSSAFGWTAQQIWCSTPEAVLMI